MLAGWCSVLLVFATPGWMILRLLGGGCLTKRDVCRFMADQDPKGGPFGSIGALDDFGARSVCLSERPHFFLQGALVFFSQGNWPQAACTFVRFRKPPFDVCRPSMILIPVLVQAILFGSLLLIVVIVSRQQDEISE